MPQYRNYRNLESSLRDSLQVILDANFSSPEIPVRIGKTFNAKWKLPTVAVYWDSTPPVDRLGVGEHRWIENNLMIIEIYAKDEGLKLDLTSLIVQGLREGIDCHTVAKDPSDQSKVIKTPNGSVHVSIIGNDPVTLGDNTDKRDMYRQRISITIDTVEL